MCKSNECKVISCKGRVVNKEYCRKHLKALLDGTLECKVSDCNREMLYDGYCGKHHMQWRRYDRVFTDLEFKEIKPNLFCKVDGCLSKRNSGGYCEEHGYVKLDEKFKDKCKEKGCSSKSVEGDLCIEHYIEKKKLNLKDTVTPYDKGEDRTGTMCKIVYCCNGQEIDGYCGKHAILISLGKLEEEMSRRGTVKCKVDGCESWVKNGTLCPMHKAHMKRYGRVLTKEEHKQKTPKAYCRAEGCYVREPKGRYCEDHQDIGMKELKTSKIKDNLCLHENCKRKVFINNICTTHYIKDEGEISLNGVSTPYDKGEDRTGTMCKIVYCCNGQEIDGYCTKHAILIHANKLESEMKRIGRVKCKIDDCIQWSKTDGLCARHKNQERRYGKALTDKEFKEKKPH
ncbi:hypothetical protein, partial [Bacillus thuringiensis]